MSAFAAPRTVGEAVDALAARPAATLVAGGTDLLPAARTLGWPLPDALVSLHAVDELRAVVATADGALRVGAGATHGMLATHPDVRARAGALADACAIVGSPATRTVATIGGNVATGSPAMDTGAPLLVHDAVAHLARSGARRTVALADLLVGPGAVALEPEELIACFELPAPPAGRAASAYVRHGYREAMEVAVAGAAARLVLDDDGRVADARVALTAVAPTCVRAPAAEALLTGRRPDDAALADAAAAACADAAPIDDHRAPADYRAAVVAVVARRALAAARERALAVEAAP